MIQLKRDTHGHVQCYNAGCRCDPCIKANTDRIADQRRRRAEKTKDPNDPRHGKRSFYVNHGCKCDLCSEAHKTACAEEREARGKGKNLPYRENNARNTSGRVGVAYSKHFDKWVARITVNGKDKTAYRDTFEEAVAAREEMERLALEERTL